MKFKNLAEIAGLLFVLMVGLSMQSAKADNAPPQDEAQPRGDMVFGPFLFETHKVSGNTVHRFYDSETGVVCYMLESHAGTPWGCSPAPIRSILDDRYEGKDAK
jgi:hypothetical protein